VAPKLSHALRKNFTDAPVPFRKSGKTFNVYETLRRINKIYSDSSQKLQWFSLKVKKEKKNIRKIKK